jgi:UTP--glucose-1-phosphate uridylyltransferase
VDEARAAGIDQFCLVTGRGKTAMVEHFDVAYELEHTLRERNKTAELETLRATAVEPGSMITVRQQVPMGLGHAIWCARAFVGDDPFAILLPDDLMQCDTPCLAQLAGAYRETGGNVVAVEEVPRERVNRYGVLDVEKDMGHLVSVKGLVEKPPVEKAPSNLTIIGRYVLMPEVIGHLAKMERGAGGEVQLTDGMAKLIGRQPLAQQRDDGRAEPARTPRLIRRRAPVSALGRCRNPGRPAQRYRARISRIAGATSGRLNAKATCASRKPALSPQSKRRPS